MPEFGAKKCVLYTRRYGNSVWNFVAWNLASPKSHSFALTSFLLVQENVRTLYKALMRYLSHESGTTVVFALSVLAKLCLHDEIGEKVKCKKNHIKSDLQVVAQFTAVFWCFFSFVVAVVQIQQYLPNADAYVQYFAEWRSYRDSKIRRWLVQGSPSAPGHPTFLHQASFVCLCFENFNEMWNEPRSRTAISKGVRERIGDTWKLSGTATWIPPSNKFCRCCVQEIQMQSQRWASMSSLLGTKRTGGWFVGPVVPPNFARVSQWRMFPHRLTSSLKSTDNSLLPSRKVTRVSSRCLSSSWLSVLWTVSAASCASLCSPSRPNHLHTSKNCARWVRSPTPSYQRSTGQRSRWIRTATPHWWLWISWLKCLKWVKFTRKELQKRVSRCCWVWKLVSSNMQWRSFSHSSRNFGVSNWAEKQICVCFRSCLISECPPKYVLGWTCCFPCWTMLWTELRTPKLQASYNSTKQSKPSGCWRVS